MGSGPVLEDPEDLTLIETRWSRSKAFLMRIASVIIVLAVAAAIIVVEVTLQKQHTDAEQEASETEFRTMLFVRSQGRYFLME